MATTDPLRAIDWGTSLSGKVVQVRFAEDGEVVKGEFAEDWSPYARRQALSALERITEVTELRFEVTTQAAKADITLAVAWTGPSGDLGETNPPGVRNAGDALFNVNGYGWEPERGESGALARGGFGYATLLHELGHAFGLAHPHDGGGTSKVLEGVARPFDRYGIGELNQGVYTMMSYNHSNPGGPAGAPRGTAPVYGLEAGPSALDIAVLQEKYGANDAFAAGDDVYRLRDGNGSGTFYDTIWDAGGDDVMIYRGRRDAVLDLTPASLEGEEGGGGWLSYARGVRGGFTIAAGVEIERAVSGRGDDDLHGSDGANTLSGRAGWDRLFGDGGPDTLMGGRGADTLRGQAGRDLLHGGAGRDDLKGGPGRDVLLGDGGRDRLEGGRGRDRLDGGAGRDDLKGGPGPDVFVFSQPRFGRDVIDDYGRGADRIDMRGAGFAAADLTMTAKGDARTLADFAGGGVIVIHHDPGDGPEAGDFLFA